MSETRAAVGDAVSRAARDSDGVVGSWLEDRLERLGEDLGAVDPHPRRLVKGAWGAAGAPAQAPWPELLADGTDGLMHVGAYGDVTSSMRAVVQHFGDGLLDLALTVYEKRLRDALTAPPPSAVLDWIARRSVC